MDGHVDKRKKTIEKALERRNIIRELLDRDGVKTVYDIQKILASEYNIHAVPERLYEDIRYLNIITEADRDAFNNRLISNCEKYLCDLEDIIATCTKNSERITAIKAYFLVSKDMQRILSMAVSNEVRSPSEVKKAIEKKGEEVDIKFG